MLFNEILNNYLKELNCNSKKLSVLSGISESVISRYRSGERTPNDVTKIEQIADALSKIASDDGKDNYSKDEILNNLRNSIKANEFNYENFANNLNKIIIALNININDMAKYIAFDASHISKIRYGKAKTSDPVQLSTKICKYICSKYADLKNKEKIATLLGCKVNQLNDDLFNTIYNWLVNNNDEVAQSNIKDFLKNLDSFNLNDYIKAIKFDELKVPSVPFYKGKTKNYYGLEEMKKAELDFFKIAVLSRNKEDILMCSDMPMEDMAEDLDFGKKWMFGIALSLKKGLNLKIIHNLDRPFKEMMLGLESWIPIYMTGQVSPYYLKEVNNNIYNHLNYVCGNAALSGECINGYHDRGKYYLTNNKEEIEYYKQKMDLLFKKANSLMTIYREENKKEFKVFLINDANLKNNRKRYLLSLPLFTIDDQTLTKILDNNKVNDEDKKRIFNYRDDEKNNIKNILDNNVFIKDIIYHLKKDDFKKNDFYLSLENLFYETKIKYDYESYEKHLNDTLNWAKKYPNYKIEYNNDRTFKNISLTILENNYVILSKNANPIIHFVIKHPKLVNAIENFKPPVKE